MQVSSAHIFDRIAFVLLSCTVLLTLVGFLPGGTPSANLIKGYVLVAGISFSLIFWVVGRLIEGVFRAPSTPVLGALGFLALSLFLSALFSPVPYLSFWGNGFDQGAFIPLLCSLVGVFLASVLFDSKRRFFAFLSGLFFVYLAVALFQILHLIFPSATAFGIFFGSTDTPFGAWTDLAYISGTMLVSVTLILAFFKSSRALRVISFATGIFALFFLLLSNIFLALVLACIGEICVLVYTLLVARMSGVKRFPTLAFVVSLVLLFFIIANASVGGLLAKATHASYASAGPDASSTMFVARSSLHAQPVFGAGPNRFTHEWLVYRPIRVNISSLWNVPFDSGNSFLLTTGFLSGIIGLLAILIFVISIVYEGARRIFVKTVDPERNFFSFGVFLVTLYLLAVIAFASPGASVTVLAFFCVGLLLSALTIERRIPKRSFSFLKEYRAGFFTILGSVIVVILAILILVFGTKRLVAGIYFERATQAAANGNVDIADARFAQAISLSDIPEYEAARAQLAGQILQNIFAEATTQQSSSDQNSKTQTGLSSDQQAQIQDAVTTGNAAAQKAVTIDPTDPISNIALGNFLSMLVPLKVENASDNAGKAYQTAITEAPNYPESYLQLAELDFTEEDMQNARDIVSQALAKKPNYTDAYFLLAKIDESANDNTSALGDLTKAVSLDPENPDAYFTLGLFEYQSQDYTSAVATLHAATALDSTDASSWYYLALADEKSGKDTEARTILTALHTKFPSNPDITNAFLANVGAVGQTQ